MNFMGLGVSFGAKDDGLITALGGIETRLAGIQESLIGMNTLQGASAAAQGVVDSAGAMESGVAAAAEGFRSLGDDAVGSLLGIGDTAGDVETDVGSGLFKTRHRLKLTGFAFIDMKTLISGLAAPITGAIKLMGNLAKAFSPAAFDSGLKSLQEGVNLMNSMESELFSTGVSARQMGANFGYTGAALDKFESQAASMAYNLDVGIETAARAIRGFEEAGDEMRAAGFKNASEVAKFSEASGVNVDSLRNTFMAMTRVAGMTGEQIQQVASSLLDMGRKTGDVSGAMEQLPEVMKMIEQQVRLLPPGYALAGKEAADFTIQTAALAAGLFKFSQNSDEARESSMTIAKAILEAQSSFQDMFTGINSEIPGFLQDLAVIGVDTKTVFNLMKSGPQGFVQGITDMVAGMDRSKKNSVRFAADMELIRTRLKSALGDEAANKLVTFFLKADDATMQTMASVKNATGTLAEFGKEAHKASFNLSDRMDRALQRVNTSLRSLSRSKSNKFIKNLQKDSKNLANRMKIAGERGTFLGKVLGKISEADQIGGLTFIPESLRSTAVLAGEGTAALMKTWDAFKAGGGVIGVVRNGLAMFAADMALTTEAGESFGTAFNRTADKFAGIYAPMIEGAGDFVEEWVGKFAEMDFEAMLGSDVDPESAVGKIKAAFASIEWRDIWEKLKTGIKNLWAEIKPQVDEFLGFLSDEMAGFWKEHGGPVKDAFWIGIIGLFSVSALMPILWGALSALGGTLMSMFAGAVMTALGSALSSIASWAVLTLLPTITSAFISVGGAILGALTAPVWAIVGIMALVVAAAALVWYNFGDEISAFFSGMWKEVKLIFGQIGTFFSELFGEKVTNVFLALGTSISSLFGTITGLAKTLIGGPFGAVFDWITGGGDEENGIEDKLGETTKAAKGAAKELSKLDQHERDLGRRRTPFTTGVVVDPRTEAARQSQLAGMSEELQAIHDPMWWSGSGGYRDLFDRRMGQLIQVVTDQRPDDKKQPNIPGGRIRGGKIPDNTRTTPAYGGSG
jgi:hypothetical protein